MPPDAELLESSRGYWSAWQVLTHDRPIGAMGGAGRIPWSSIARFAETHLFDDDVLLSRMMWGMDDVYLEWLTEKQKKSDAS